MSWDLLGCFQGSEAAVKQFMKRMEAEGIPIQVVLQVWRKAEVAM